MTAARQLSNLAQYGSPADTGLTRRIAKVGESIDSRHLVSTNCPAQARMPNCEYVGADVREHPPRSPQTPSGQAVRSLRLHRTATGSLETQCAGGESKARREAALLVFRRSSGLYPDVQPPSLCDGLSAPYRARPLSPRRPACAPVPGVQTADALRPARRAPVVCDGRCILTDDRPA